PYQPYTEGWMAFRRPSRSNTYESITFLYVANKASASFSQFNTSLAARSPLRLWRRISSSSSAYLAMAFAIASGDDSSTRTPHSYRSIIDLHNGKSDAIIAAPSAMYSNIFVGKDSLYAAVF